MILLTVIPLSDVTLYWNLNINLSSPTILLLIYFLEQKKAPNEQTNLRRFLIVNWIILGVHVNVHTKLTFQFDQHWGTQHNNQIVIILTCVYKTIFRWVSALYAFLDQHHYFWNSFVNSLFSLSVRLKLYQYILMFATMVEQRSNNLLDKNLKVKFNHSFFYLKYLTSNF